MSDLIQIKLGSQSTIRWLRCIFLLYSAGFVHSQDGSRTANEIVETTVSKLLQPAFEVNSLLLSSQPSREDQCTSAVTNNEVPTTSLNETSFPHTLASWFQIENLDEVLAQPNVEYKLVKKVWRDGREKLGIVPPEILEQRGALTFFHNGFSLVVNKLERHWGPVAQMARQLEQHFGLSHVSCNLYLTPSNASGFESHWDWMDVIVVQMSGEKTWSLWKEPTLPLSTATLKREPELHENQAERYSDLRLGQGDILYIPRGTLHNASTGSSESLHLTFGIEPTDCLVADWFLHCVAPELHPFIYNAIDHLNIMRQSLPVGKSWAPARGELQALFQDALDQLNKFGLAIHDVAIDWEEALVGLEKLQLKRDKQRTFRWARDDEIRASNGLMNW